MTYTKANVQEFLATVAPFDKLSKSALVAVSEKVQLLRYRMGQTVLVRDKLPAQISIIYEGQVRLLGYDPRTVKPVTLSRLGTGSVLGWVGLVRGEPCETAIASEETVCLVMEGADFLALIEKESGFAAALRSQCSILEAYEILGAEINRRADGSADLKELAQRAQPEAIVRTLTAGKVPLNQFQRDYFWFVSGGSVTNYATGSRLDLSSSTGTIEVTGSYPARIVGFPSSLTFNTVAEPVHSVPVEVVQDHEEIPYAPDRPPEPEYSFKTDDGRIERYTIIRGRGEADGAMACFQMLAKHMDVPFRRDVVRRVLMGQLSRIGKLSLDLCGAIAEMMGLSAQLIRIPSHAIGRLEAPAMVLWQERAVLLYEVSERELIIADPEAGLLRRKPSEFASTWGETGEVLLIKATKQTPKKRFGLDWFLPAIRKHRRVLIEVFIASFFVQLFALANPLMIQVIIDKVIVQGSADTLQVLGIFMLVLAIFEGALTWLRTTLFVDTTNRIDMSLGTEIIDHLLRLPLRYFEKRPVGELSTRINELENIRSFLTGTALTVVLDAVFSVIYIFVMLIYSWLLTLVSLATIPLFMLLAVVASPIIRSQLRVKAERNAETQSYLVEVLGGIQTVKAQNMELRSRWQWQQKYARYVSAGFKTVLTSTSASAASNFLNQFSALLVLWVGAYLVLQGTLSLGQLIAFRIIAGYVTSPLLRLAQLWQSFQEVGLSIERLADIVDAAPEADESDRLNIPMPPIQGAVKYDGLSFRFNPTGPMQLNNINLEFPAGAFIGIVGQSGSGKSTMMKLLPRLYDPEAGRILIDGYDIGKVELYSLRQQIGIVPQDTLLFDGTIQENIALNAPDASADQIIEAAKIAVAHEFIMALPQGYNTRVGERGASLSGGQRQRIAIARTIMQNPRMIIMDEATSALDYDTERRVSMNLAEAFQDRTVFFITHRLTTIRNAEIILMMDKGSVVEMGTHEELMAMRGRYYCLYQQQEAEM